MTVSRIAGHGLRGSSSEPDGALGNIHDRKFNQGKVVDFIEVDLHFWPANPWPTFNVADMLLCAGVGLLMLCLYRQHRDHLKQSPGNSPKS